MKHYTVRKNDFKDVKIVSNILKKTTLQPFQNTKTLITFAPANWLAYNRYCLIN